MRVVERVALWLRALVFRTRVETEMEKEMRLHLEMETENNVKLGMSPGEARRRALIAFGGVEKTKEAVRDERQTRWLEQVTDDLRYAIRGFRSHPGFAIGVVVLVALGVGVNTAIFSVINNLLLSPLPYADGNRMVNFHATSGGGQLLTQRTLADVGRWRAVARAVEQVTVFEASDVALGDSTRGATERVQSATIVPGATAFVGMRLVLGRDILPSDTIAGAPPVVLLAYDRWQNQFGGATNAIGRPLIVDGVRHTVIGVMPKGFNIPFVEDNYQVFPALRSAGSTRRVSAIAKLRRGFSVADANRELESIFTTFDKSTVEDAPTVERAMDQVPSATRRMVLLMFGAVGILLLIASANVANLLMARAWARQREFAIRAAMGAGRSRLVRQVLTESVALALIGGVVALAVSRLTLWAIVVAEIGNWGGVQGATQPAVLLWGFGLSAVTGLVFGVAPAIFAAGSRAADALKAGNRSATGSIGARRFRGALVVSEVALSVVLLVAAGLLIRTVVAMQHAEFGFQPRGLFGVEVRLPKSTVGDSVARQGASSNMLARVRAVPGVRGATLSWELPPHFVIGIGQLEIEGHPVVAGDSLKLVSVSISRPDIFAVTGIRITQGRAYVDDPRPTDAATSNEIVVNESFAGKYWPGGNAVGGRLRIGTGPWRTIVGVANNLTIPGENRARNGVQFYQAMPAAPTRATIVLRTDLPLAAILPAVTAAIKDAHPGIKIGRATIAEQMLVAARRAQSSTLELLGAFAGLALVLAAFGLHAVIAYSVGQRTREIGVRVALGAETDDVLQLVMGQGLKLALAGIVLGAVGGVLVARTMRALLFQVAPADPITLVAVAALLASVALLASYAPARRAARVDPVDALRSE